MCLDVSYDFWGEAPALSTSQVLAEPGYTQKELDDYESSLIGALMCPELKLFYQEIESLLDIYDDMRCEVEQWNPAALWDDVAAESEALIKKMDKYYKQMEAAV